MGWDRRRMGSWGAGDRAEPRALLQGCFLRVADVEQTCWQTGECCCLRLSLNCFQFFISSWSQAIFGGYHSKSKSKITLLILPALGHGQTGADQAPSTEVPVLLTRNPFPTIFGEDQSATPQPFWRFLHPPHSAVHKAPGLFPLLHEPSPHRSLHTGSPGHEQTVGPTSTLFGQGNKNLVFRLPGQITAIF